MQGPRPARWPTLLAAASLIYLVSAVFWPILGFEFVDYDVDQQVVDNCPAGQILRPINAMGIQASGWSALSSPDLAVRPHPIVAGRGTVGQPRADWSNHTASGSLPAWFPTTPTVRSHDGRDAQERVSRSWLQEGCPTMTPQLLPQARLRWGRPLLAGSLFRLVWRLGPGSTTAWSEPYQSPHAVRRLLEAVGLLVHAVAKIVGLLSDRGRTAGAVSAALARVSRCFS